MALSTKARIAAVGGALALGVLGAGGAAYAAGTDGPAARYVTVVDENGTTDGTGTAPQKSAEDCPEDGTGTAPGGTAPGTGATGTPGDA